MNNGDKVVTLPNAAEIMERLQKVDMGANAYMAERFYPLIAQEADQELSAHDIVMMLILKIQDFMSSSRPPISIKALHIFVPQLIDALVDDKEVAEAAKRFHQEAMDTTRKR